MTEGGAGDTGTLQDRKEGSGRMKDQETVTSGRDRVDGDVCCAVCIVPCLQAWPGLLVRAAFFGLRRGHLQGFRDRALPAPVGCPPVVSALGSGILVTGSGSGSPSRLPLTSASGPKTRVP